MTIDELFENMDWPLLRQQKDMLLVITCDDESNPLTGLVTLLDEVYDAAEAQGMLTFNDFLESGEEVNCGLQIDGLDTLRHFRWDGSLSISDAGREKYARLLSLHYQRDEIGDIHLLLENTPVGTTAITALYKEFILELRNAHVIKNGSFIRRSGRDHSKFFAQKRSCINGAGPPGQTSRIADQISYAEAQMRHAADTVEREQQPPPKTVDR